MECFVNMIVVVIFSLVGSAKGNNGAEVRSTDNAEQFALLCRIYNVAKNPPIHHVDMQDPLKIVEDIDALNASFIHEKALDEAEQEGNSSVPHVKPTITREAAVAQAILNQITRKAHNILEEIGRVNATRDIEKVKANFSQVIFGEEMNESHLCDGALKNVDERGAACGSSGLTDKGAGKNLVVDFFCLCAMRSNDGLHDACGVQVGGGKNNGQYGWDNRCPSTSSTLWASIKKGCGRLMHTHPKSTEEGHEVLGYFLKHLKSGGLYRWNSEKNSDQKAGILGTGAGKEASGKDIVCNGSRGGKQPQPGGICVYYGSESNSWEDIDWLKKLKTALNNVDTLNNKTVTIQQDIEKLKTLLHRAEQIYETTKVITEFQNPAVPTNLPTPAKRLTAYNAAWRYYPYAHFILLFVLLS